MKKNLLLMVMVSMFVLLLTTLGYSWQGRMAGMGDASGLIEDESDYLIHPAAIASGKGLNVYGNYRLTYDKTTNWDYSMNAYTAGDWFNYSADGQTWKNEVQVGTAFTLGAGRMGIFLEYLTASGKYDGVENDNYGINLTNSFDIKDNLDNFALRIIYGLPVGSIKLGGELQIAYRNEERQTTYITEDGHIHANYPWVAWDDPDYNLYPYMIPFESKYWDAQGKVSLEGLMGSAKYTLTLKGGIPFASDNQYSYLDAPSYGAEMDGNVSGYKIGGDFWLRVPVSSSIVLPFVISAEYRTIKRDGAGIDDHAGAVVTYEHETKNLAIKVGGGVDFMPAKGTKLAAGIYYDYLSIKEDTYNDYLDPTEPFYSLSYSDMPKQSEHRVTLKALAEKDLSSTFALRGGFSAFYGLIKSDYAYASYYDIVIPDGEPLNMTTSGSNWGANISIGATVKIDKISLEPFLNGGYMKYKTSGDGTFGDYGLVTADFDKTNWIVGGGLSVKF